MLLSLYVVTVPGRMKRRALKTTEEDDGIQEEEEDTAPY